MGAAGTAAAASGTGPLLSPSASSDNCKGGAFDERQWVIQLRNALDEDLQGEKDDVRVSVFKVTNSLLQTKPDAYVPQLIALGPYHQRRPELYEMERYKQASAKRTQKTLISGKFQDIVDAFRKQDTSIRAHYHRYLDSRAETLAWMMAVDACFLLEFLQVYAVDAQGRSLSLRRVTSRMKTLVDIPGRKSAHSTVLWDIMMMENQIPLFLLQMIMKMQVGIVDGDVLLSNAVTGFLKELSPFKMLNNFPAINIQRHAHLLEVLYCVLVPIVKDVLAVETIGEITAVEDADKGAGEDEKGKKPEEDLSYVKPLVSSLVEVGSTLNVAPVPFLKKMFTSWPVTFVFKVPWKVLSAIPGFSVLLQPVVSFFSFLTGPEDGGHGSNGVDSGDDKPPKIEEITVPSVQELVNAGIRFSPTNGDLSTISFDTKTSTFYLPVITLDINTDVVLRNLVAYEAAVAAGPLVLARYTELMNGIIDTVEDVKLLRQSGVVVSHLKSDADVANIWNGMSKSIRLTKVPFMDKAIEEVNRYHNSRWRVKARKLMKKYIFGSWRILTFLAAVLLLLLTALQSFCSVYPCVRLFNASIPQLIG